VLHQEMLKLLGKVAMMAGEIRNALNGQEWDLSQENSALRPLPQVAPPPTGSDRHFTKKVLHLSSHDL
jgi:hypothetical protein